MSPRSTSAASTPSSSSVLEWRRERLIDAGFTPEQAVEVAGEARVDLHALLELVDRGCSPPLAVRILAPLDEQSAARAESRAPGRPRSERG